MVKLRIGIASMTKRHTDGDHHQSAQKPPAPKPSKLDGKIMPRPRDISRDIVAKIMTQARRRDNCERETQERGYAQTPLESAPFRRLERKAQEKRQVDREVENCQEKRAKKIDREHDS